MHVKLHVNFHRWLFWEAPCSRPWYRRTPMLDALKLGVTIVVHILFSPSI